MGQVVRKMSEIRTGQQKQDRTSRKQTATLLELEQQLDQQWFALKRTRHEVGRILHEINALLANDGDFAEFLRNKRIPRSTAYDLISDFKRWTRVPAPLRDAAARHSIDLSERKFASALARITDELNAAELQNDQADKLVMSIAEWGKRRTRDPFELTGLQRDRRALHRAFEALTSALGNEAPKDRAARLNDLLAYILHTLQIKADDVRLRPAQPPTWLFTGIDEEQK